VGAHGEERPRSKRLVLARTRRLQATRAGSRARRGSYERWKLRRLRSRARPRSHSASSTIFAALPSSTSRRRPAPRKSREQRSGPSSADAPEDRLDRGRRARGARDRRCPMAVAVHHVAEVRATARIGRSDASCAQYSNTRRRAAVAGRCPRGYAPTRAVIVSRCARSTAEIESSCTAVNRRITASTSARRPQNRGADCTGAEDVVWP